MPYGAQKGFIWGQIPEANDLFKIWHVVVVFFCICGHPEVDYLNYKMSCWQIIYDSFSLILETASSIFNGTEDEAHKVIAKTLKYAPDRKTGSGRTGSQWTFKINSLKNLKFEWCWC